MSTSNLAQTESTTAASIAAGPPPTSGDIKLDGSGESVQSKSTQGQAEGEEKKPFAEGQADDVDADKTVFHDPTSFNLKHPLYSPWTLYFSSPNVKNVPKTPSTAAGAGAGGQASGWMDDMRKVAKFDSVEEFWG